MYLGRFTCKGCAAILYNAEECDNEEKNSSINDYTFTCHHGYACTCIRS